MIRPMAVAASLISLVRAMRVRLATQAVLLQVAALALALVLAVLAGLRSQALLAPFSKAAIQFTTEMLGTNPCLLVGSFWFHSDLAEISTLPCLTSFPPRSN